MKQQLAKVFPKNNGLVPAPTFPFHCMRHIVGVSVLVSLFFIFSIQTAFSQRIFQGELVTTESDTLRGEVWFGLSGKMPTKTRLVYFSEDGVEVQRFKPKDLNSMILVHDITGEKQYYEKTRGAKKPYLYSIDRDRDVRMNLKGGGAITASGDTIFGKRILFPPMDIPIKGVGSRDSEVVAYWLNTKKGYFYYERVEMSNGQTRFLEPVIKGKLSCYKLTKSKNVGGRAMTTTTPGTTIYNPSTGQSTTLPGHKMTSMVGGEKVDKNVYYLCKEGLGCQKVQSVGFQKLIEKYTADCPLGIYKKKDLELFVKKYNEQCGGDN
ncbi:MAG: hypothetical protein R2788_07495 [Saprospiraceae bacterium]